MKITLKDGSVKEYSEAKSVYDIAADISSGLARVACAGEVNGEIVDLRTVIDSDCELNIVTASDPEGLKVIRHTASHVLAQAVKSGYYGDTVAGMLGIGVLLLLVIYFILCRKYQKRIIELQENAHPGWNWWKLRKQVTELEDKKAEGIVEDIRRAAQSYMTV